MPGKMELGCANCSPCKTTSSVGANVESEVIDDIAILLRLEHTSTGGIWLLSCLALDILS